MSRQYAMIADGLAWAVPRSGLIFTRRGDTLVLASRMPHDPAMSITEVQLHEQQQEDYEGIRACAETLGITVLDETCSS